MDENMFVTIVVLCVLRKYGDKYKQEWRMIANKATRSVMTAGNTSQNFKDLSAQLEAAI